MHPRFTLFAPPTLAALDGLIRYLNKDIVSSTALFRGCSATLVASMVEHLHAHRCLPLDQVRPTLYTTAPPTTLLPPPPPSSPSPCHSLFSPPRTLLPAAPYHPTSSRWCTRAMSVRSSISSSKASSRCELEEMIEDRLASPRATTQPCPRPRPNSEGAQRGRHRAPYAWRRVLLRRDCTSLPCASDDDSTSRDTRARVCYRACPLRAADGRISGRHEPAAALGGTALPCASTAHASTAHATTARLSSPHPR